MAGNVQNKIDKTIYVTRPLLPDINDVMKEIRSIWESRWLTNMGEKHQLLENKLKTVLNVPNVSLFNNGTLALLTALKMFDFPAGSEIITTPFTFAATPHCISYNGLKPVFCDIEPETMCIDPYKIESLITDKTVGILGVHVYGFPCNVKAIESISNKRNLKVIYDGAHAFSTEIDNRGIGSFGDITMFSFHATKLFNTIEGGCLAYNDCSMERGICNLRNFGICSEEYVDSIGLNGKMNELQASIGLLNLSLYKEEQERRNCIKTIYDDRLKNINGIYIPAMPHNSTNSHQYYPIVIQNTYGLSRNELYDRFKKHNIMTRKYFYPVCSDFECYKDLPSAKPENLPVTSDLKNKVLCLPYYGTLDKTVAEFICDKLFEWRNGGE